MTRQNQTPLPVSRETEKDFEVYETMLRSWQSVKNLVAPSTLNSIRDRHIRDSVQIFSMRPHAASWIDLGSGGGFPGLVVAICLKGRTGARVDLIESDHRKCAFLRAVARATDAPAHIHCGRIETVLQTLSRPEIVTARALASMEKLLEWTAPLLETGTTGLFLKGRDIASELTAFAKYSSLTYHLVPSSTEPDGSIVVVETHVPPASERKEL